jgi:hypothetical protein
MRKVSFVAFVIVVFGFAGMSVAAGPVDPAGFTKGMSFDKAEPGPHPGGWVPLERTGGETCATATVIPTLPYTDDGSTAGAVDDYDEVCPYTGSLSPDVVYSYTPGTTITVDVTLCVGVTDYDTKLYVYENTCPDGGPFACNDDSCTAPGGQLYVSALSALTLTAGNTYYFVVDGYGSGSGNYTIEITEGVTLASLDCDPLDLLYGQNCDGDGDDWSFGTSTAAAWAAPGYAVYDDFQTDFYEVCDLHFWGLSLFNDGVGWNACDPTADGGMPFTVGFYLDNGAGQPDTAAPICEYFGVVPDGIAATAGSYSGFNNYKFDISALPSCCVLPETGTIWVMIRNEAMVTVDCAFLWGSSGNGPTGNSWQFDYSTGGWTDTLYERGMCLTGTTWPVELQNFSIE